MHGKDFLNRNGIPVETSHTKFNKNALYGIREGRRGQITLEDVLFILCYAIKSFGIIGLLKPINSLHPAPGRDFGRKSNFMLEMKLQARRPVYNPALV